MRLTLLFILSGLLSESFAQRVESQRPKWHVNVEVQYDGDPLFTSQIRSYISRELRALGDVDETYKDADYKIRIFSLATNVNDVLLGYSIHVSVVSPIERLFSILALYGRA